MADDYGDYSGANGSYSNGGWTGSPGTDHSSAIGGNYGMDYRDIMGFFRDIDVARAIDQLQDALPHALGSAMAAALFGARTGNIAAGVAAFAGGMAPWAVNAIQDFAVDVWDDIGPNHSISIGQSGYFTMDGMTYDQWGNFTGQIAFGSDK